MMAIWCMCGCKATNGEQWWWWWWCKEMQRDEILFIESLKCFFFDENLNFFLFYFKQFIDNTHTHTHNTLMCGCFFLSIWWCWSVFLDIHDQKFFFFSHLMGLLLFVNRLWWQRDDDDDDDDELLLYPITAIEIFIEQQKWKKCWLLLIAFLWNYLFFRWREREKKGKNYSHKLLK